jgi:hypothetical protein
MSRLLGHSAGEKHERAFGRIPVALKYIQEIPINLGK